MREKNKNEDEEEEVRKWDEKLNLQMKTIDTDG